MKAICIIGSPRQSGSTAFVVDRLIDGMKVAGIDVQRFSLGQLSINYCQGCRECEVSQRCIQRDDMDRLLAGILESEIVLLASPSYWGDVTGQMKVFIDRSLPLCNAKTGETPVPKGKIGVAVAIRAGQSRAENKHIVDTFEHYFGHLGIKMVASLTVEGIDTLSDIKNCEDEIESFMLGRNIVEMLQEVQSCTDRGPERIATS
ncbi:flavodoxin family protein [Chloroflexota bacterium]